MFTNLTIFQIFFCAFCTQNITFSNKTKTENVDLKKVRQYIDSFDDYLTLLDEDTLTAPEFSIRDSWFNKSTIKDLTKITAFVNSTNEETVHDFFKVALSEVIRTSSETRNGEFKLYRMSQKALEKFNPEPIKLYKEVIESNYSILNSVSYEKQTEILLYNDSTQNIEKYDDLANSVDIVITSPPYGDSHTTVAYGQFSRLANEWLGYEGAGSLDKRLLGGKKVSTTSFDIEEFDIE